MSHKAIARCAVLAIALMVAVLAASGVHVQSAQPAARVHGAQSALHTHSAQSAIHPYVNCVDVALASASRSNGPVTVTAALMTQREFDPDTNSCVSNGIVYAKAVLNTSSHSILVSGSLTAYWWINGVEKDHATLTFSNAFSATVITSTHDDSSCTSANTNAEAGWAGTDPVSPFHTSNVCP